MNTARNAGIQVYNKPPNLEKRRSKGAVAKEHQATGRSGPPRPRTIKVAPIPGRSQARRDSVRPKFSLSSPLLSSLLSATFALIKSGAPRCTHARATRLAARGSAGSWWDRADRIGSGSIPPSPLPLYSSWKVRAGESARGKRLDALCAPPLGPSCF